MDSRGTVAEKCGALRQNETESRSHPREDESAFTMLVMSRYQSRRLVRMNGPSCFMRIREFFFGRRTFVFNNQRWF